MATLVFPKPPDGTSLSVELPSQDIKIVNYIPSSWCEEGKQEVNNWQQKVAESYPEIAFDFHIVLVGNNLITFPKKEIS